MKRTVLLILLIMFSNVLFAKHVDISTAQLVGEHFFTNTMNLRSLKSSVTLDLVYTSETTNVHNQPIVLFYVFNVKNDIKDGFVIVSADDNVIPIIGYSTEGIFSPNNIAPNVKAWLESYENQIHYIIDNNIPATQEIYDEWNNLRIGSNLNKVSDQLAASVSPLISTRWDQGTYYNAYCPYDNSANTRTATGCVATAMAQIMKYWNYPTQGTNSYSYYHSRYGYLSANFGATTYQWGSMPNSVTSANNAVATLMYHCGISTKMNYDIPANGGSGAYVISSISPTQACAEYALKTYFGYKNTLQGLQRNSYATQTQWTNMLKAELDVDRPILYVGYGTGGGHAFVCDGYDNSGYFHFNWGWSGMYDGYFAINALNPGGTGIGGGAGGFNYDQQALIGIEPPLTTTKCNVSSIVRANAALEKTNLDTVLFTVTLAPGSNCTPTRTDFTVTNGNLLVNDAITGSGTVWTVKVATNVSVGYDTAKTVSLGLTNTGNLLATTNMINENYNVRKKFTASATLIKPTGQNIELAGNDGIILLDEDGITCNNDISNTLTFIGGSGNITQCAIVDTNISDKKTELLFYYSGLQNAAEYSLAITQNAIKDAWGNKCQQINMSNTFTTTKANVISIMRSQQAKEKTNADTLLFTIILAPSSNYTLTPNDLTAINGNIVSLNKIFGSNTNWQLKVATNASSGYDIAKLVLIELPKTSKVNFIDNMVNERYSVRKKFATIATLKKPIGEELNISGTDGIIIFNEDSIAINSNVKNTLTIIGGDGTTTHHTINDINAKDQKTELLFYYSGLQNATEYTLKITQDALKDAWGNKCAQMNFTNGFTTKKAEILSIMRSEHAKEKTNIDTLLFTVILEQGANYIPQQNDFIVTNGNLVQNNPITGLGSEWQLKVLTYAASGYELAKIVSINLSSASKLKLAENMINENYNVRKKFMARATILFPSVAKVNLLDTGKILFDEDEIFINSNVSKLLLVSGGDNKATIQNYFIRDINPSDSKSEFVFTYSYLMNATQYSLSFANDAFKDAWGNSSGKLNTKVDFYTEKAKAISIEKHQPFIEKTNADTLLFTLKLEKGSNYTPCKEDFILQNCNLVQNNDMITGQGLEWQIKVLTNIASGYDTARLVALLLSPESNLYSSKSFHIESYNVRKKFLAAAYLKSPSGDSVATAGSDGKIIFNEDSIQFNTVAATLRLADNIGTVHDFKLATENNTTSILFSYSGLSNSTKYAIIFSSDALKDAWGNLSGDLNLSSNVFTTCEKTGLIYDLQTALLSNNYPNPFTQTTFITWRSSVGANTKISVFDISGKLVRVLLDDYKLAGEHSLQFNSKGLGAGIYYYQIQIGNEILSKKMMIVE